MKRPFTRSALVLLAAPLVLLLVQGVPGGASAGGHAPSASVVAQARAEFIKVMSAHVPAVGRGGWVSPGAQHASTPRAASGTVASFPSINRSGYADAESGSTTVSQVSGDWTVPAVQCLPAPILKCRWSSVAISVSCRRSAMAITAASTTPSGRSM